MSYSLSIRSSNLTSFIHPSFINPLICYSSNHLFFNPFIHLLTLQYSSFIHPLTLQYSIIIHSSTHPPVFDHHSFIHSPSSIRSSFIHPLTLQYSIIIHSSTHPPVFDHPSFIHSSSSIPSSFIHLCIYSSFFYLSLHPSIYLSIDPPFHSSILSIHSSIYSLIHSFIHLSLYLSIQCIHLSITNSFIYLHVDYTVDTRL